MRSVCVFNSVCAGIVVLVIGCSDTPNRDGTGRTASEDKRGSPDGITDGESKGGNLMPEKNGGGKGILITVEDSRYLAECKMLFLRVRFWNVSSRPMFVVANEFAYVDFGPGKSRHRLVAQHDGKELILDLSHVMPTPMGIDYFVSEEGSFGPEDYCIEMPPELARDVTYVFQFPLKMDRRMSEFHTCEVPQGLTKVRLRFGYSDEDSETFLQRETRRPYSAKDWQQRVVAEWQSIAETTPIEIDFSQ